MTTTKYTQKETYRLTMQHPDDAVTLIPEAYRKQEFFEKERDLVFRKSWVCVGYTSQVKEVGQVFTTEVAGEPLFIIKDKDKNLQCFYNVCRHRGAKLVSCQEKKMSGISCPYHSWTYSLKGDLIAAPYMKESFCKKDHGLMKARVATWGCFVFVCLDDNLCSLEEWLGDLPLQMKNFPLHELEMVKRSEFHIKANWKLVVENYVEYYHLPAVHPELVRVAKIDLHQRYQGKGMYIGFKTTPLTDDPQNPLPSFPTYPGLDDWEKNSGFWIHIYPNISLFLLPDHIYTLLLHPTNSLETKEYTDLLIHKNSLHEKDAQTAIEQIYAYWDNVNRQDFNIVEKVQKGMAATVYPGGRLCSRFEEPIHRFQNILINQMIGQMQIPEGD